MVKDILLISLPKATQTEIKAPYSFAANGRYLLLLLENIFCCQWKISFAAIGRYLLLLLEDIFCCYWKISFAANGRYLLLPSKDIFCHRRGLPVLFCGKCKAL